MSLMKDAPIDHIAIVVADLDASLALYTQSTLQGAFILAKAKHSRGVAIACVDHLRRYVELLFSKPVRQRRA